MHTGAQMELGDGVGRLCIRNCPFNPSAGALPRPVTRKRPFPPTPISFGTRASPGQQGTHVLLRSRAFLDPFAQAFFLFPLSFRIGISPRCCSCWCFQVFKRMSRRVIRESSFALYLPRCRSYSCIACVGLPQSGPANGAARHKRSIVGRNRWSTLWILDPLLSMCATALVPEG